MKQRPTNGRIPLKIQINASRIYGKDHDRRSSQYMWVINTLMK